MPSTMLVSNESESIRSQGPVAGTGGPGKSRRRNASARGVEGQDPLVLERSTATGYAGVENPLFHKENTRMLFGDARESLEAVLKGL